MLDLRWIRDNPEAFDAALASRGATAAAARIVELDARHREAVTELQQLQSRRNEASKEIGAVKSKGGDAAALMAEVAAIRDRMQALEATVAELSQAVDEAVQALPNVPAPDVPVGRDETDNKELRVVGARPAFDFKPRDHIEIGETLGLMDFGRAAKLSGARFVVLTGALARLERALAAFMLDLHTQTFGYTEVNPPFLVRDNAAFGTGQLPKFGDDLFRTTTGHWLIPTAEVPLTNLFADEIVEEAALPLRLTAHTPCFRSEAGAAGRDTRGMIRLHQFNKVELVSIAHPDQSAAEHERMTGAAEEVLKRLGLHYRVIVLCTGDMGFSAQKTYDIEVWLPGQDAFREISSCSNCGDFQARRMKARYRPSGQKGTRFVHTLNGSGLAVGRALIAVMENYQRADGGIDIPPALRPYMDGLAAIAPAA